MENRRKANLSVNKDMLIGISIFLFPFDSLPIISQSIYRPAYVLPLILYFIFFVINKIKHKKVLLIIFILYLFGVFYTFLITALAYEKLCTFGFVFKLTLGLIGVISFYDYFCSKLKKITIEQLFEKLSISVVKSSIIPILVGIYQVITLYILNSVGLYSALTKFFSYRNMSSAGRIQLVTGEPAWASIYILWVFLFTFYFYKAKYKNIILTIYIIFFFLTFSTFGMITGIFTYLIYYIFFKKNIIRKIVMLGTILLSILFVINISHFLPKYMAERISGLTQINLKNFATSYLVTDNSAFIRILNPYIGLLVFKETHFLGTGIENYMEEFPNILKKRFPQAKNVIEVKEALEGRASLTPRNMIARLVSEFGVFGIFILLILTTFFMINFKRLLKTCNNKSIVNGCVVLFAFFISSTINFDSYVYYICTFLVALFMIVNRKWFQTYEKNYCYNSNL